MRAKRRVRHRRYTPGAKPPLYPGFEAVGEVVKVGSAVKGIEEGAAVAVTGACTVPRHEGKGSGTHTADMPSGGRVQSLFCHCHFAIVIEQAMAVTRSTSQSVPKLSCHCPLPTLRSSHSWCQA